MEREKPFGSLGKFVHAIMQNSIANPPAKTENQGRVIRKTLRVGDLILDIFNDVALGCRFRFRLYNLGREHTHMSIAFLHVFGWTINLRTPSMAD